MLKCEILSDLFKENHAEEKIRSVQKESSNQGQTECRKDAHLIR